MRWLKALLGLLFQERCGACRTWGTSALCPGCDGRWEALRGPGCAACAAPVSAQGDCTDCRRLAPAFTATVAAGAYAGVAREAIHALKYRKRRELVPYLAERVARASGFPEGEWWVVPVPMPKDRLKERGYNQAALLGRAIARSRKLPFKEALRRTRATAPQHALPPGERLANAEGAFLSDASVRGRRVLLVDDVMTTGATCHWAAVALIAAGAVEVRVAVVARTLPSGDARERAPRP